MLDHEFGCARRTVRDRVSWPKVTKQRRIQPVSAGPVAGEQQLVHPPWRIPATPVPSQLGQPRPHILRRRRQVGSVVGDESWSVDQLVAGQASRPLSRGGPGGTTQTAVSYTHLR